MNSIQQNLQEIQSSIPSYVTLVAVSKTHPAVAVMEAYDAGQRVFGENKVQELCAKYDALPKDIEWHMIGHLQSNKVRYILPFVSLIHGADSVKLLSVIDKEAGKIGRTVDCLLQIHIAMEETKFGFSADEIMELMGNQSFVNFRNIRIRGLMGMASFTENREQVRSEFRGLKSLFENIKSNGVFGPEFNILSMGMSGDYGIAIEEGSNMVRVGSSIFGVRNYN